MFPKLLVDVFVDVGGYGFLVDVDRCGEMAYGVFDIRVGTTCSEQMQPVS